MRFFDRRFVAAVASASVVTALLLGTDPLDAQESGTGKAQESRGNDSKVEKSTSEGKTSKAKKSAKSGGGDPARRVPYLFGKLGLTDEQREEIYKIERKYYAEIQELEQRVESLRLKMMSECEEVLTPSQKKMLDQQRKTAAESRKTAAKAKAKSAG
jgi:Spy/CpxP family protein refolding chaperone